MIWVSLDELQRRVSLDEEVIWVSLDELQRSDMGVTLELQRSDMGVTR